MRTIDLDEVRAIEKGTLVNILLKDNDHIRPDSRGKEFVGEYQSLDPERPGDQSVFVIHMIGKVQHREEVDQEIFPYVIMYGFHDWLVERIEIVS